MPIHIRRLLIRPTLHPIRPSMVRPTELKVQARDNFLLRTVGDKLPFGSLRGSERYGLSATVIIAMP